MAVATPVLERKNMQNQSAEISADELHNMQIKENYKRLINPELNINELRGRTAQPEAQEQTASDRRTSILRPERPAQESSGRAVYTAQTVESAPAAKNAQPYLVTNARADAEIFRADSPVNQRRTIVAEVSAAAVDEDENEDLRPTETTIQYRTYAEQNRHAAKAVKEEETHILGKREKIIIATFISVVVALFILVIVNSAVIAGLNSELSVIQDSVVAARESLADINSQIWSAISEESINAFAQAHNMIR